MPKYTITVCRPATESKIVTVEVPEGATPEQIEDAAFDAAHDNEDADSTGWQLDDSTPDRSEYWNGDGAGVVAPATDEERGNGRYQIAVCRMCEYEKVASTLVNGLCTHCR